MMRLFESKTDKVCDWDLSGYTNARIIMPASADTEVEMYRRGFMLADRTMGVSINLMRSKIDFDQLVRMEISELTGEYADVLRIAQASFVDDRRFHIKLRPDLQEASGILAQWIDEKDTTLICKYKGAVIGFLTLRKISDKAAFVHLAAVEARYRITGAAVSLYAKAASMCKASGYQQLNGRISTKNTAVMNLYASLGASFSEPEDIFLIEVE